jgi:protein disulfide-isomerase A6
MDGEDYKGGRDYDSLKGFIEEKLEVKCDVNDPKECTDKEKAYIEKMTPSSAAILTAQISRLEGMKESSMKPDLKQWLMQRLRILKGLHATRITNGEL